MPVIKTHASISLLTDNAMNLEGRGIFFWAGFWLLAFGFSLAFGFCVWLLRLLACGFWLHFSMEGIFFWELFLFLVFFKSLGQIGAASLAICCILELKSPICMPTWLLAFGFVFTWLLAFGSWFWLAFWLWFHLAFGFWLLAALLLNVCVVL